MNYTPTQAQLDGYDIKRGECPAVAYWRPRYTRAGRLFPLLLAAVLLACAFTR